MGINFDTLTKNKVWTTRSVSKFLFNSDSPSKLKKTEAWLIEHDLNLPLLNEMQLFDENGRHLKRQVTNQIIRNARKKRKTILFVSIHKKKRGLPILFSNDGRKGRRWFFFNSKNPSLEDYNRAFQLLVMSEEKDVFIIPSGEFVSICRDICHEWGRNEIEYKNLHKVRILLELYSQSNKEIFYYVDKKKVYKVSNQVTHLDRLEAEAIHIMREVVSESKNPVMLYSVGKDSSVMLHLAKKAFYPSLPPFPMLHVDTRWKFQAMYDFRNYMAKESGMDLIVHVNPEGIKKNINPLEHGSSIHTDIMKTQGLKQAIDKYKFDVAFGGARRDEEKSRAKERICSFRSKTHRWDPKSQRPELWNLYNLRKSEGENIRIFPLSNWTEIDIWLYIHKEQIPIVPLYFALERPVIKRNNMLIMIDDDRLKLHENEQIEIKKIRFRTLGCYPLTGAIESDANDLSSIILEILNSKNSERQGRAIDLDSSSSMEKKKHEGYF